MKRIVTVIFLLSAPAYGQLDSNTITVTATRFAALQPDQVLFGLNVTADIGTSLDDVVASLAGLGITASDLSGAGDDGIAYFRVVPSSAIPPQQITWQFRLAVSISKIKDTIATVTALQKSLAQNPKPMALDFSINGTSVSPQLQQMQTCSTASLLSDARAQAQNLASAANLFLGVVLAISSPSASRPPCTMTVKFSVTR